MSNEQSFWDEHIEIGSWNNQPNYECVHCPFANPDKYIVRQHISDMHLTRPKKTIIRPTHIVDRYGRPHEIEEPAPAEDESQETEE